MDEPTFFRILHDEPDNEHIRLAYGDWLEETGDDRATYVRLMNERLQLQAKLDAIDAQLRSHASRISNDWLDIVFPLRIRSPVVGRCYTRPNPDTAPFVGIGDRVAPETVVCLIESMKLFIEVTASVHGVVAEITVANGEAVEYNQILFRVSRPPDPLDNW